MDMQKKEISLSEIQDAMANHEFKAYYQPQYDAITYKLKVAEALVRWIKPDGTIVFPGDFIPVLEKSGAICELDWYMVEEACKMLKYQREKGIKAVPVSVNFSRYHIGEEGFIERLCGIMDKYGIPHKLLQVEITESAIVDFVNRITNFVDGIRAQGFSVAVDDFGSGLSSLSMIKDLAFDVLKIDRSLLSGNFENEKERIMLESILDFAHRLKLTTVAEGVETMEQLAFLKTCSCEVIQGYLFAKPMPESDYLEVCEKDADKEVEEDILFTQAPSRAISLLLDVVFTRYPLIIYANLTRNSYYMMTYENFTAQSCTAAGVFEELIEGGAKTMHPEDSEIFKTTFSIANQMAAYERGEKTVSLITRQLGDDGVYRRVETTNYFVKNPSVDDLLVITMCQNLD